MTLDEASKVAGIRWRTLKARLIASGWLVPVGGGQVRCSSGAIGAGYLVPMISDRHGVFGSITVEVGYKITNVGLAELQRRFLA
ncbi:hypothetical protein [Edaphosphingomonas haloaromaticamans]|nr:hypothetical protein [Sphingomonas haloaromaticamans]